MKILPNVELSMFKKTSLQKNVMPILALIWTCLTFILLAAVLYVALTSSDKLSNEPIIILIVNTISNVVSLIAGFYFGSSEKAEKEKEELEEKLEEVQTNSK